jgi:hypothetical protein
VRYSIIVSLALTTFFVLQLHGADAAWLTRNAANNARRGEVGKPDIVKVAGEQRRDFGRLAVGSSAEHSRQVFNIGTETVRLRVVQTSCPCVSVLIGERAIGVSESQTVTLRAPVLPISGRQAHWALLEASSQDGDIVHDTARFRIEVSYEADITFVVKPSRLWISGIAGSTHDRTVYVRSTAIDAVNVHDIRVTSDQVRVKGVRRFSIPDPTRTEEVLAITLTASLQEPGISETALLFASDDPAFRECRVPISLRVFEKWAGTPDGFAFIVPADSTTCMTREVILASESGETCPAASIRLQTDDGLPAHVDGVEISSSPHATSKGVRISVRLDPGQLTHREGVYQVAVFDGEEKVLRVLPLAWVK